MKSILSNLLIVEDNSFIRNNLFNAVKNISGIGSIRLAESLQEAISFLNETNFKLIILDLKLPDGNGIEILKFFKEKQIETKVFVFSISIELKKNCLKYGASTFFDKSKDFDKLIEAVKKAY
ncbi:Sporulation initiation phosphotransferase F [Polaribacter huanghezhanensis]|uniref:response regulator n=1 Tax=Polaribacter huanghezhanensis TaxID=1354726 RepID=UPI0026477E07|nr:response regulator [Polaribacter huanghezhanensis]WKD85402.1 Sporulation initiation phosphotransferase F [Polaribacter huanghezhanensis]